MQNIPLCIITYKCVAFTLSITAHNDLCSFAVISVQGSVSSCPESICSNSSSETPLTFEEFQLDESTISACSSWHGQDARDDTIPDEIKFVDRKHLQKQQKLRHFISLDDCFKAICKGKELPIPIHEHPQVRMC